MKVSEITKTEIEEIYKFFKYFDKQVELVEYKNGGITEKELEDYERRYRFIGRRLGEAIARLREYEVTYQTFKRYIDEKYLYLLDEAFVVSEEYFNKKWAPLRLFDEKPGSERKAKKMLKEWCRKIEKQHGLFARVLFSDEVERSSEEFVYKFRDWLIYGIEDLIDKIEPARQEYIMIRKGNVKGEVVEQYLLEEFPEYQLYSQWITSRRYYETAYYPDLKLD